MRRNDERAEVLLLITIAFRLYPHDAEKSLKKLETIHFLGTSFLI